MGKGVIMEQWLAQHLPEGVLGLVLAWVGYMVKRRDKRMDVIENKIDQMPFVYAMKDDIKEVKEDVKEIKNHLMNKSN